MTSLRLVTCFAAFGVAACGPQDSAAAANIAETSTAEIEAAPTSGATTAASAPVTDDAPLQTEVTYDKSHETGARILRETLVAVGRIDGQPITDVRLRSRCTITIQKSGGLVEVDMSKVGNFASRDEGGRTGIELDDGRSRHTVSVPTDERPEPIGDAAARVDMALSTIAGSCQS